MQTTAGFFKYFVVVLITLLITPYTQAHGFFRGKADRDLIAGRLSGANLDTRAASFPEKNSAKVSSVSTLVRETLGPPKFFSLKANSSGHLFAGTFASGIIRSTDNGVTWKPINKGLTNTSINVLVFN